MGDYDKTNRSMFKTINGMIIEGEYQGLPVFVPYYWDLANKGMADEPFDPDDDNKCVFYLLQRDRILWPEIGEAYSLELWKCPQGTIYAKLNAEVAVSVSQRVDELITDIKDNLADRSYPEALASTQDLSQLILREYFAFMGKSDADFVREIKQMNAHTN